MTYDYENKQQIEAKTKNFRRKVQKSVKAVKAMSFSLKL